MFKHWQQAADGLAQTIPALNVQIDDLVPFLIDPFVCIGRV